MPKPKPCDICDVTTTSDMFKLLTLRECRKLEESYRDAPDDPEIEGTFICHPCSTPHHDPAGSGLTHLHPFDVDCCLCGFNQQSRSSSSERPGQPNDARSDAVKSGKKIPHAFHKIERWKWNEDGDGGEEWGGPDGEPPGKQLWCHTLCGYGVRTATGAVWGADVFGTQQEDPFDHFQLLKSDPFKIPKNLPPDEKEKREDDLQWHHEVMNTVNDFRNGTVEISQRCAHCSSRDKQYNRIVVQCNAGDHHEHNLLRKFHKDCHEPCTAFTHIGCAKYRSNKLTNKKGQTVAIKSDSSYELYPRCTFFFPGVNDLVETYLKARAHPDIEIRSRTKVSKELGIKWKEEWKKDEDVSSDKPLLIDDLKKILKRMIKEAVDAPVDEIFAIYCKKHAFEICSNMASGNKPGTEVEEPPESPIRKPRSSSTTSGPPTPRAAPQSQSEEEYEFEDEDEDEDDKDKKDVEEVEAANGDDEPSSTTSTSTTTTTTSSKSKKKKKRLRVENEVEGNGNGNGEAAGAKKTRLEEVEQVEVDHVVKRSGGQKQQQHSLQEPFSPDELKKIANELKSASASRVVELMKELATKRIRNVEKEVDFLPNSETSIGKYLRSISKKFKTDEGAYKRVKEAYDSLKNKIYTDHVQEKERKKVKEDDESEGDAEFEMEI
ncbi:hypothetical protein TrLO_g6302 [Triparma laevis f. longispina]|uniref:Uncharacterized protein n=1 Tax=Triparma laevis f. longispina TaxID=1714387 RepID=A0A9W7KZ29_9STRA|nr:hypothetical protein TrLO_g6302 [Triparma laevis f. longispina]